MNYLLLPGLAALLLLAAACRKDTEPPVEQLDPPVLSSFYELQDTVGAAVTLVGKHFSPQQQHNIISFQGADATPFFASSDTLKVRVPAGAASGLLRVKVNTQAVMSTDTFTLLSERWRQQPACPGSGRFDGIGFAIGSKCYVGIGTGFGNYNQDFWEFDIPAKQWTRKADFAGGRRREAISFVLNGKGYVGFGTNTTTFSLAQDFYEYDPAANNWTRKANIPSSFAQNAVGLAVNGRGYIITGGYTNQVLEYTPQTDAWSTKRNFPGQARSQAAGFVINSKAYIGGGNSGGSPPLLDFWEYDPAADQWTRKADLLASCVEGVGFDLNGKGYLGIGFNSKLGEYNPLLNMWKSKFNYVGAGYYGGVAFSAAGKGYVANGITSFNNVSSQLWSFTP